MRWKGEQKSIEYEEWYDEKQQSDNIETLGYFG